MTVNQFGADDKLGRGKTEYCGASGAPGDHSRSYIKAAGVDPDARHGKSPVIVTGRVFGLFRAVLFAMGLHGVIRVAPGMNNVTPCGMSMVCRLFMVSRLMMLGGFRMMTGGLRKVL
jgi:hypothetical protein